jgi:hypothetical protein
MSIIRVRKDARYFTASNEPFVDKSLSWEARGLMGYLLTKPDAWEVRTGDLIKQGPAGEHKVRRILAELRQAGYMNRIRIVKPDGTFDWITEVYESPEQNPKRVSSGRFSTSGLSTSGKVPDIVSTEEVITESIKKERKPKPINSEQKPNFRDLAMTDYRKIPEIKLFMDATDWIPGSFVLETVYDFVHAGLTGDAIEAAFKAWTARGYKPGNVEGYLTWARDGIPTGKPTKQIAAPRAQRVPSGI